MSFDEQVALAFFMAQGKSQEERDKLEEAMKNREKKYGYKRGSNASYTKPADYAHLSENQFADPVGYNYPTDDEHVRAALAYWNHMDNRKAYGPDGRAFITERIVRAALKKGVRVSYYPKDPDYRKLPENLKKQIGGYDSDSKKSMLDTECFRAYQEAYFRANGKQVPVF
jgi:hypothetical protein